MITDIPFCFKDKNEEYLTLGKLQEFCKINGLKTDLDKVELTASIVDFAKKSEENSSKVSIWMDETLKEGIKKLIICKINNIRQYWNKTADEWEGIINNIFNINTSSHLLEFKHENKMKLCGYKLVSENGSVVKVEFLYSVLLKEYKNKNQEPATIIYPIYVDLYLKEGYIVSRSKSKSAIYRFEKIKNGNTTIDEISNSTNCDKLIDEAINITIKAFEIEKEDMAVSMHRFKTIIHKIVDETTHTPKEIKEKLDGEIGYIERFAREFLTRQGISIVEGENFTKAVEDLNIFMEKYISINYQDKQIFTNDRYGYPIKISVTDEDLSSIEETTLEDKPLQCTPIFFDNKKIIQKQKKCDNLIMVFKRTPKTYFTNKTFQVITEVKKGTMHIDLRKYVLEEDIDNVLSRVIRSN